MTDVLHRSGVAKSITVDAVEVILRKELPISTVYRLGITYKEAVDEGCPRSLFLKLPRVLSEVPEERAAGAPGGDDRAEVEFYRDIAPGIGGPPLIRCFDAAYSDETRRSHILLDDLTETHTQPEQEHAPSEEMSRLAVGALAKAHAAWWRSPAKRNTRSGPKIKGANLIPLNYHPASQSLGTAPKQGGEFDLRKFVANLNASVTEFLKVANLTPLQEREYRRMLDAAPLIWGRLTREDHLTVTHGDMHWWNFHYPKDPRTHAVHIFDWQLWHIDLGARDLAFLLALGGFAEPRPALEDELLRVYHDALGVPDYSWDMLIEDYRWSAIRNLNIPVIFRAQGKHESTWRTALRRAFEAYERLECGSLFVDR